MRITKQDIGKRINLHNEQNVVMTGIITAMGNRVLRIDKVYITGIHTQYNGNYTVYKNLDDNHLTIETISSV